ncbi:MAG: homoserine dehydrogenase [Nitrososphaeraceae archaeon]
MRIILIGYGVIGQNLTKLLISKSIDLYGLYGIKPRIVACVDKGGSALDPSGLNLQRLLDVKKSTGTVANYSKENNSLDPIQIIESTDAEILLELTPTNLENGEPGLTHITTGMKYGKNIITANKGPLSVAFPSLVELANYNGVAFRFSGTVGGGTPVLEFAKRCLKGDRIVSFRGILNGTTNYILSKMQDGLSFEEALTDAKKKGYVEANPSLDIDGFDAGAKLVIMANWLMGLKVTIDNVSRKGISEIKKEDIVNAEKEDMIIKLIAKCENKKLVVEPTKISKNDPLCVNGTLNAVTFSLEHSGDQTIVGRGAGGIETASAVLRDMIEIKNSLTMS